MSSRQSARTGFDQDAPNIAMTAAEAFKARAMGIPSVLCRSVHMQAFATSQPSRQAAWFRIANGGADPYVLADRQ
jgi:hypothetical protein